MKKVLLFCLLIASMQVSAQETTVTIGSASLYSDAPATTSAESYCQTVYEAAQVGTAGYIVRLAYERLDNQSYTNAMDWVVYLGHTNIDGFYSTNADQITLANLTQVFDGQVEVTSTHIIVNFDTPFYYNGTDKLAIAVNELTLGKHYSYIKASNYNNGTSYSPTKAFKNYSTFASVDAANPAACDQISSYGYQPNTDIIFSTCLWPSALSTSNPTTTTLDIDWTDGLSETAWQVEAVSTGEAQGTGVVQSAASHPYTFTGLDHSTVYDFYVRADCGSSEYSLWEGPVTGTTACGVNTCLDEDFNSYNHLDEPRCFTTVSPAVTGAAVGNPGDLFLHIGGFGDTYVSLPEFSSLNGGLFDFRGKSNGSTYNVVTVGTIADPNNTATFTALETIAMTTSWASYSVDFSSYAGADKYICFQYLNGVNGNTFVYVDDLQFDGDGVCVFNKTFVDKDATGNNDGTSWADAYTDLQDALTNYNGNEIWVAEGTYKPHASDRTATFSIPSGANIYGGFAGTETAVNQRVAGSNTTILSGDLNGDDNATLLDTEPTRQDNSYHVITLKGDVQNVVLDGFTISGGNANGGTDNSCGTAAVNQYFHSRGGAIYANPYVVGHVVSADVTNCIMENNTSSENSVYTGFTPCGITNTTYSVSFDRCIVRNNFSGTLSTMVFPASGGYGIVSNGSITNSLFHDNETTASWGSVLWMVTSTANGGTHTALAIDMENNTFANNVSGDGSTFYAIRSQSSTFTNNIVWDNGSTSPFNGATFPVFSNNLIEGGISGSINADPLFTDSPNDDYTLDCTSPAINSGDDGITLSATDLAGNPREYQTVDMGAYEYQTSYSASASESSVCLGESVTFTTTGASNVSWTGGVVDGIPFTPSATDTYTVTADDSEGCTSTQTVSVTVETSVPNAAVSAQSEVCSGTSATVSIASSGTGANYFLRDDANDAIVDGPIAGTGNAMNFNTGAISSTTTYNVFATPEVQTDYALDFDGVNDYVWASADNRSISSQITVSTWIKSTATGVAHYFINKYNGINGILFYLDTDGKVHIDGRDGMNVYRASGASTTSVTDGNWHYVTGTVNVATGAWKVYVDGTLEASAALATGSTLASNAVLYFGGQVPNSLYADVELNQISIWNSELDQTAIQNNMNTCLSGTETGLVGYFQFDEGTGFTVEDLSATGIDGSMANAAAWVTGNALNCWEVGCDLELTQTVTIGVTNGHNLTETATVCNGESFTFPDGTSQTITSQTVHTSNLTTVVAGCDSIIETTVNVNPTYNLTESASVCSGESFTFPDGSTQQNITSQVVHTSNLSTVVAGCDSIIETTVNVNPSYNLTETASVCAGTSYTFPDGSSQTINSQVVHTSNLQTVGFACDSIIETTVNVAPEYNLTETIGVCSGADVTFPDGTTQTNITSNVVYTSNLTTVGFGCDSIIETTVNVMSAFNVSESATVCTGSSYTFPDGTVQNNITSQVVYSSTLAAVSIPCDSIVETTVNVAPDYDLTETATVCEGESYTFPDGTTQSNITSQVVYTSNLTTVGFGCDSIVETTVNVTTVDVAVSQNGGTLTADEAGATYQWVDCDNGNAAISGETSQSFMPSSSGNYAVEVTLNGCTETSGCTNMIVTGIHEAGNSDISVFPVPAKDVLFIKSDDAISQLAILSASGALILVDSQNRNQVDISGLAKGVYLLSVVTEKGTSHARFIKD